MCLLWVIHACMPYNVNFSKQFLNLISSNSFIQFPYLRKIQTIWFWVLKESLIFIGFWVIYTSMQEIGLSNTWNWSKIWNSYPTDGYAVSVRGQAKSHRVPLILPRTNSKIFKNSFSKCFSHYFSVFITSIVYLYVFLSYFNEIFRIQTQILQILAIYFSMNSFPIHRLHSTFEIDRVEILDGHLFHICCTYNRYVCCDELCWSSYVIRIRTIYTQYRQVIRNVYNSNDLIHEWFIYDIIS